MPRIPARIRMANILISPRTVERNPVFLRTEYVSAQPCFYAKVCHGRAEVEKQGKAVCRDCGRYLQGLTYPLRDSTTHALACTCKRCMPWTELVE